MLGVPAALGAAGWLALALGVVCAGVAVVLLRERLRRMAPAAAAGVVCLVVTTAATPYVARRFGEDLRLTTRLHGYDAQAAGPVQAYLPGYLVAGAERFVPRGATYAAVVGDEVPWATARAAFPSLALQTLFPRRSVADPRAADYVVTWGVPPGRVAPVTRVWVVRERAGPSPAVLVGKVR